MASKNSCTSYCIFKLQDSKDFHNSIFYCYTNGKRDLPCDKDEVPYVVVNDEVACPGGIPVAYARVVLEA